MKKYSAFIGLVALAALPGCNQNDASRMGHHEQYADNDHNNWQERHDHMEHDKERMMQAKLDDLFKHADTNHDGTISWKEMEAYAHHMFREADTNHNGKLTRDEVMAMMHKDMERLHAEMNGDHNWDKHEGRLPAKELHDTGSNPHAAGDHSADMNADRGNAAMHEGDDDRNNSGKNMTNGNMTNGNDTNDSDNNR